MSIEVLYYISQIVAVIVIVATLFAILWQGRQSNKIARADLTLTMWLQMGTMHNSVVDTPEKGELFARALSGVGRLTEGEKVRLSFNLAMLIGTHEAAFNLRDRGLIEKAVYVRSAATTCGYMRFAIMQRWWERNRDNGYSPSFQREIDNMKAEFDEKSKIVSNADGEVSSEHANASKSGEQN